LKIQLIQRVAAQMTMCFLLKRSIAFGYCYDHSYFCIGERDIESRKDSKRIKITLFSLENADQIDLYWAALSRDSSKFRFLNRDAIPIWRALQARGINPFLTRIEVIAHSSSRVYGVFLPTIVNKVPTFVTSPTPEPFVMIKVVHSADADFEQEKVALETIRPHWYYGYFETEYSNRYDLPRYLDQEVSSSSAASCRTLVQSYLQNSLIHDTFDGGLIFMKAGQVLTPEMLNRMNRDEKLEILDDCQLSLQRMHEKGFLHCDARVPNICKFDDTYELVDFGLAQSFKSSFTILNASNFDSCSRSDLPLSVVHSVRILKKIINSDDPRMWTDSVDQVLGLHTFLVGSPSIFIQWGQNEDFLMLHHNLFRIMSF
jgi:serine/threonine protein kinase